MSRRNRRDATPTIQARDLRCFYGEFEAVKGVSLDVHPGEVFGLLGTNGAGKTTTMETLEGHRLPTHGEVRVCGSDPAKDRTTVRREMGIMLQEGGFVGELTVGETVRMCARLTSRNTDIEGTIRRLRLGHRRDVRVSQLSGGERRRLDLAVATLGDPGVLFLDEPTTGLDPESRTHVWKVIRDMADGGATVLLTTHYLEEAEALADMLAIMHEGQFVVTGTTRALLTSHPARLAFDVPEQVPLSDLPATRGTVDRAALRRGRFECRTEALQDDLVAVLDWASNRSIRLARLEAKHASLADVFSAASHPAASNQSDSTVYPKGA